MILFFTYGVSLQTWADYGLLDREILLYTHLTKLGIDVTFVTYGDLTDYIWAKKLAGINIVPVYSLVKRPDNKLLRLIQSFIIPFYLGKIISKADILKTNQMYGAWVPIIAKLLFNKKVIVRCGYEWYRNTFVRTKYKDKKYFLYKIVGFIISFLSYKLADRIIISNQNDAVFIQKKFFINFRKVFILGNYIDINRFQPI